MQQSVIRIVVAGIYIAEALQSKQDQSKKAQELFEVEKQLAAKRDQEAPSCKLLPYKTITQSSQTKQQKGITLIYSKLVESIFGVTSNNSQFLTLCNIGLVQFGSCFLVWKLAQITESLPSANVVLHSLQVAAVVALTLYQLLSQTEPKSLEVKVGAVTALLLLSEYLQSKNNVVQQDIYFSINDLVCIQLTISAFILLERLMLSLNWHDQAQTRSQDVVNRLASAIFEDSVISEWGPGYGLLHYDVTGQVPEFCLLRHNQWFEKVLQCCVISPKSQCDSKEDDKNRQEKHGADSILKDKKTLTYRLLNQLACKENAVNQQDYDFDANNFGNNSLVSPRAQTLRSMLCNVLTEDKNGDKEVENKRKSVLPVLVQKVFQCESLQNNSGARSILKREKHRDIKISVVQLCPESRILLVKVHRLSQSSNTRAIYLPKHMRLSVIPDKKVSFNSFEKVEVDKNADISPLRGQAQGFYLDNGLRHRLSTLSSKSSKSADEINNRTNSSPKQSQPDKKQSNSTDNLNTDEDGGVAKNNFESPDNVDSAGDKEVFAGNEPQPYSAKQNSNQNANQKVFTFRNIPDLLDAASSSLASNSVSNRTNPPTPNLSIFSKGVSPKKRPYLRIISADNHNMQESMQLLRSPLIEIKEEFAQMSLQSSVSIESEMHRKDKEVCDITAPQQYQNLGDFMKNVPFLEVGHYNDKNHKTEVIESLPIRQNSCNSKKWADTEQDSREAAYPSDEANLTSRKTITNGKNTPMSHLSYNSMNIISSQRSQAKSLKAPSLSPRFSASNKISSTNVTSQNNQEDNTGEISSTKRFLMRKKRRTLFFPGPSVKKKFNTVHISDKYDSMSKKLGSDMISIMSPNEQKVKNNRIFVYKIIHDLRHPSDAIQQGLSTLVTELNINQFKRDFNLRMSEETMSFKYVGQSRVRRALKSLKNRLLKQGSNQRQQQEVQGSDSQPQSSQVCSSESPQQSVSLDLSKSQPIGSDRLNTKTFSSKFKRGSNASHEMILSPQQQNLRPNRTNPINNQQRDNLAANASNAQDDPVLQSWKHKMSQLHSNWLQVDLDKIKDFKPLVEELKKDEFSFSGKDQEIGPPQPEPMQLKLVDPEPIQRETIKEEKKSKEVEQKENLLSNDSSVSKSDSCSVSSIENKVVSRNESEILCDIDDEQMCEGNVEKSYNYSSTEPQKKDFHRESVCNIVSEKLNDPSINVPKYKPYSLAVDRLVYNQQNRQKITNQGDTEEQDDNDGHLNNIFQVMDRFQRESMQVSRQKSQSLDTLSDDNLIFKLENEQSAEKGKLKSDSPPNLIQSLPVNQNSKKIMYQYDSDCPRKLSQEENKSQIFSSQLKEKCPNQSEQLNTKPCDISWARKFSKLKQDFKIIVIERTYLVAMVDKMLQKTQKVNDKLVNMEAQAQMMMTLLRDLMNQAMMANNTFTMVKDYFDITLLIKRSISMLQTQANYKQVRLVGPVIPNPIDKYYFQSIYVDELRYSQFIINFLSNSIKFTQSGGEASVHLKITQISEIEVTKSNEAKRDSDEKIKTQEFSQNQTPRSYESAPDKEINHIADPNEQQQWQQCKTQQLQKSKNLPTNNNFTCKKIHFQMIFRDSGCGISSEVQQKLFQNFGKLSETQDVNKTGVGLGLSICKEIIMAHGGTVNIQSAKGLGTDFIINMSAKCIVDESRIALAKLRLSTLGYCTSSSSDKSQKQQNQDSEDDSESVDSDENYDSEDSSLEQDNGLANLDGISQRLQMRGFKQTHLGAKLSPKEQHNKRKHQSQQELMLAGDLSEMMKAEKSLFTIYERSQEYNDYANLTHKMSRCLLANDNVFLLHGFEQTLSQHFALVDTAEDGQQALNLFLSKSADYYSVIVLDISMPIMDGIEACTKMLEHLAQCIHQRQSGSTQKAKSLYSGQMGKQGSSVSVSAKSEARPFPFIYALTSECEPEVIQKIQNAGFKDIFSTLDQEMLQIILTQAGLPYKYVQDLNMSDVIEMKIDEPKSRKSSDYKYSSNKSNLNRAPSSNESSMSDIKSKSIKSQDRQEKKRKRSDLSFNRKKSQNNSFC